MIRGTESKSLGINYWKLLLETPHLGSCLHVYIITKHYGYIILKVE